MSKPDIGSIIHIKNQWNILVIGNYYVNYQNYQNLMLLTSSDTKRTLMHLLLLEIPPRENWFQYVHRVYTTAIDFPCLTFLVTIRLFCWQEYWFSYRYKWTLITLHVLLIYPRHAKLTRYKYAMGCIGINSIKIKTNSETYEFILYCLWVT